MRLPWWCRGWGSGRLNRIRSEEDPAGPGCARPWPLRQRPPLRRGGRPRTFCWCRVEPSEHPVEAPWSLQGSGVPQSSHLTLGSLRSLRIRPWDSLTQEFSDQAPELGRHSVARGGRGYLRSG